MYIVYLASHLSVQNIHALNTRYFCLRVNQQNNARFWSCTLQYNGNILYGNILDLDTFILRNCDVTSPSIGTIRVSCDPYHQIIVTLTCTNNCSNPMVIINGSSPLTVTGLDPGITYNVTINVFDGSQVVLSDQTEMRTITVMRDIPGKFYIHTYVCTYV